MIRKDGLVVMSEEEYFKIRKDSERDWEAEYKELLNFLPKITARENQTTDIRLSRKDFMKLHAYGVEQMDYVAENYTKDNNLVNGNGFTVHWHGYYCDCIDGAQPANYIIPAIKDLDDEMGEEF